MRLKDRLVNKHTHSDHNKPPDCSYSTHTDSVRSRGTHPPAQTFQSPDCKISPANSTARWSGHTAVPCRGFCWGVLPCCFGARERIVLVPVFYLPAASRDVGSAVLLIQMIVVIATLFSVPAFRNRHRNKTFLHLRAYFRCYHRYSS